jgi:predicted nucleic acid-binding Zn ribbon protein
MFQYMTENHLSSCPECGGNVKRLIGAGAGAIFKGSGFYQTDYKNSSNNSNQKSEKKTSTVNETPKKKKDTSEKSYKK